MNIENWPRVMRRTVRLFICFSVLVLLSPLLFAQKSSAELRSWMLKLNSSSRADRDEARKTLRSMGPAILPELRRETNAADSGTRFVLQQLQREIERDAVDAILEGRRITMKAANLREGVEQLSQQNGTEIVLAPGTAAVTFDPPVEVDDALFWDGLQKLCLASGTSWHWEKRAPGESETEQIVITPQSHGNSDERFDVGGCFRIAAMPVPREGVPTQRWRIRIDAEEPVRPLYALVQDAEIQLSGEGTRFEHFDPDARREVAFDRQTGEFHIDFLPAGSQADLPKQMKGRIQIRCEVMPQELVFRTGVNQTQVQYAGETEVRLISTVREGDSLNATFAVTFPPSVNWQSHQLAHLHQDVWLEGKEGTSIPFRSRMLTSETMPTHVVQYQFTLPEGVGEPTLIYRFPSADRIVDVGFDIPLKP